ncbi:MAG: TetR/AcrR family transcriptional regulator [Planctomycetota bacterium]|nr:MAG: TetR/AcrR family transcriptional regulator [Planctomycetota bacterium]
MSRLPAAQRREQLLDVAETLFATQGYAGATTAQIAKAAGVTEPIIYRHFKSKRDLFVALIERTGRRTLELWQRDLSDAQDPAERLARILADNPMVSPEGRAGYKVLLQAIPEIDDDKIAGAVAAHMNGLHAFLTEEIKRAQDAHRVTSRFSAEVIAWTLIHIGMGYGVLDAMHVTGHGRDEKGTHVRQVLARILVGPSANADKS